MKVSTENLIRSLEDIFEKDIEEIHLSDSFRDYDEWDSITQLALVAFLSDEFSINISSEKLDEILTINDLFNFINNT